MNVFNQISYGFEYTCKSTSGCIVWLKLILFSVMLRFFWKAAENPVFLSFWLNQISECHSEYIYKASKVNKYINTNFKTPMTFYELMDY